MDEKKSYVSRKISKELCDAIQELKSRMTCEALDELKRQGFEKPTKPMVNSTIISIVAAVCRELLDAQQYYKAVDDVAREHHIEEPGRDFGIAS